jgi:hypothetical protein
MDARFPEGIVAFSYQLSNGVPAFAKATAGPP